MKHIEGYYWLCSVVRLLEEWRRYSWMHQIYFPPLDPPPPVEERLRSEKAVLSEARLGVAASVFQPG